MKAENIKNYVGQRIKVSFWSSWEELVNRGDYSEWVDTTGIVTIIGKVMVFNGKEHIVQDDDTISCFNDTEMKITLEVLN